MMQSQIIKKERAGQRPTLRYLEYHLVEHCNLSCNRCGHFSPLADISFSEPNDLARSLKQLAQHFENISIIRLLGGEPLLHPTPEAFVEVTRETFPNTDLRIVTNGTRLKAMRGGFWEACRRARVTLDLSLYPIMEKARVALEQLCEREGVTLNVDPTDTFLAGFNAHGNSDPKRAMAYCRKWFYCPFLKDSHLHVCALPATVRYFNNKFGYTVPTDTGIDIFDPTIDGDRILELLETPIETCRFCACRYEAKPWEVARSHKAEDYEVLE